MYGQTVSSEGKDLNEATAQLLTGLHVKGNVLESLSLATDASGNVVNNRAELVIKQSSGATIKQAYFDKPGDAKAIDRLNGAVLHICSAFVTKDEYKSLLGAPTNFAEFIHNVNTNIFPRAKGKTFTMTFIREEAQNGKWYVKIPTFPNFIELDGTAPTTIYMKKNYIFDIPETTNMSDPMAAPAASSDSGLPF
jgi:hypothetical protein